MAQSDVVVDFAQLIMPDLIDIMKTEEIDNIFEEMNFYIMNILEYFKTIQY